jgi:hypothetical protein
VQEVVATGLLSSPIPRPSGDNLDSVGSSWLSLWLWDVNSSRIVSKDRPRLDPTEAQNAILFMQHAERTLRPEASSTRMASVNTKTVHCCTQKKVKMGMLWCSRAVVLSLIHIFLVVALASGWLDHREARCVLSWS